MSSVHRLFFPSLGRQADLLASTLSLERRGASSGRQPRRSPLAVSRSLTTSHAFATPSPSRSRTWSFSLTMSTRSTTVPSRSVERRSSRSSRRRITSTTTSESPSVSPLIALYLLHPLVGLGQLSSSRSDRAAPSSQPELPSLGPDQDRVLPFGRLVDPREL